MGCTTEDLGRGAAHGAAPAALAPVRVVCFDLDGTLVDIMRVKQAAAEAAAWTLADAGLDLDPAGGARGILDVALEVGIDRDDVVDLFLARRLGRPDAALLARARGAYERAEDAAARAYPRVERTLAALVDRGYRLVLVTDAPRRRALGRLAAAGLLPFFPEVVALEDSPRGKADEAPYARAAAAAGAEPGAMLMVGDHPFRDVLVARRFGCRAALAAYGLQPSFADPEAEARADARLLWIDELLRLLPGVTRPVPGTPRRPA